ncbi:MAG: type II toxin-antitoxin system RelE/ParE family toxin [Marinilabiliaceae bacterium]|nr:type II toxin-antitoxin system RelE/ParE family toxin [Marinilabiliaceae bacterium]
MEIYEIIWTSRAIKDLRQVYDFYTRQIGEEKAFAIVQGILDKVDVLSDGKFVKIGAIDEEFKHMKRQYKKLIEKNIKITYRLSASNPIVYINRVFDTRQDPTKNK